jgi:hypothetical protein
VTLLSKTHRAIATAESSTYRPGHPHACPRGSARALLPVCFNVGQLPVTPDKRGRHVQYHYPVFINAFVRTLGARDQFNHRALVSKLTVTSPWRRCSRMPTAPLSFAKPIFYLIVLSRRRIEPSRCRRTDRPPHSYKIRIGKFYDATTKFLTVEPWKRHGKFYCGDSESESARSGPFENTVAFPRKRKGCTFVAAVSVLSNC